MSLKDEIKGAVACHGACKKILKDAVVTGKFDLQIRVIKADDQCNFGKWLYGQTIPEQQKKSYHYRTVLELHTVFHEKAATVVQLAISGDRTHAAKMLEVDGEFTKASAALTTSMLAWLKEAE